MAVYAADGSLNVTVVSGASRVPVYAPNGSINVFVSTANTPAGTYNKSGALNVISAPLNNNRIKAPNGSLYVSSTPYTNRGQRVTVVAGSLS